MGQQFQTGRDVLKNLAAEDDCLPGDPEVDGMSCHAKIWADVAREMIASSEPYDDVDTTLRIWVDETTKRWRESKFFKLYQEEGPAGFAARGWGM